MICERPRCSQTACFFMGWKNKNGKHFGFVCTACDEDLGRANLTNAGLTLEEAIAFERYCKLTVNDANPIDWPEWFMQMHPGIAHTHTVPKTKPPSVSVKSLTLSSRVQNALRRHGITTTEELTNMSDHELSKIHNLGAVSINEIHKQLKELGYE